MEHPIHALRNRMSRGIFRNLPLSSLLILVNFNYDFYYCNILKYIKIF